MDGVKRKKLCTLKIESIGWKQLTDLEAGLKNTVTDYIRKITDKKTLAIFISDYIAGMTDRYAIKEFEELV